MPFSGLSSVTEAPLTTAPEASETTPESVAVVVASCAFASGIPIARVANRIATPTQYARNHCLQFFLVFNAASKGHSLFTPSPQRHLSIWRSLVIGVLANRDSF